MKTKLVHKHYIFILTSFTIILILLSSFTFAWFAKSGSEPSRTESNKIKKKDPVTPSADQSKQRLNAAFFRETELGRTVHAYIFCKDFCRKTLEDLIHIGPEAVSPLIQLLMHGLPPEIGTQPPEIVSVMVRSRAIIALGELGHHGALSPVITALQDPDPLIRARAAEALGKFDEESAFIALLSLLKDPDPLVRETTAVALGRIKRAEALPALNGAAKTELEPHVRHEIEAAIESIGQQ